jgi:hypothetical protein
VVQIREREAQSRVTLLVRMIRMESLRWTALSSVDDGKRWEQYEVVRVDNLIESQMEVLGAGLHDGRIF